MKILLKTGVSPFHEYWSYTLRLKKNMLKSKKIIDRFLGQSKKLRKKVLMFFSQDFRYLCNFITFADTTDI